MEVCIANTQGSSRTEKHLLDWISKPHNLILIGKTDVAWIQAIQPCFLACHKLLYSAVRTPGWRAAQAVLMLSLLRLLRMTPTWGSLGLLFLDLQDNHDGVRQQNGLTSDLLKVLERSTVRRRALSRPVQSIHRMAAQRYWKAENWMDKICDRSAGGRAPRRQGRHQRWRCQQSVASAASKAWTRAASPPLLTIRGLAGVPSLSLISLVRGFSSSAGFDKSISCSHCGALPRTPASWQKYWSAGAEFF